MVEILQPVDVAQNLVLPTVDQRSRSGGSRDAVRQQSRLENLDSPQ